MILVCGEALVDLVGEPGAPAFRAWPGGSPANTAVGLGRLGTPTGLLARLAGDVFGRVLRGHLTDSGVDLRWAVAAAEPTTLALAAVDRAGVATYSFYVDGCADGGWSAADLPATIPPEVVAVQVSGSLALAVPTMGNAVEDLLTRAAGTATVVLDPNVRPALAGDPGALRDRLDRWLALADVVKVSEEDLGWLYPGAAVAEVAARWQRQGPALVAVTLGPAGVYARLGAAEVRLPAEPVAVVDTVGAGDSFTAGLLDWLHRNDLLAPDRLPKLAEADLRAALGFALHVAAITCTRPGADPPRRAEL